MVIVEFNNREIWIDHHNQFDDFQNLQKNMLWALFWFIDLQNIFFGNANKVCGFVSDEYLNQVI